MTQLQLDIPDETAAWLEQQAQTLNLSVSKYVAQLIQQDRKTLKVISDKAQLDEVEIDETLARENGWPEGFFDLYGSTQNAPLERPDQGEHQTRELFLQQDSKTEKAKIEQPLPSQTKTDRELEKENGWPEGYFDLLGSGKDDPIERPNQWEHPLKEISLERLAGK